MYKNASRIVWKQIHAETWKGNTVSFVISLSFFLSFFFLLFPFSFNLRLVSRFRKLYRWYTHTHIHTHTRTYTHDRSLFPLASCFVCTFRYFPRFVLANPELPTACFFPLSNIPPCFEIILRAPRLQTRRSHTRNTRKREWLIVRVSFGSGVTLLDELEKEREKKKMGMSNFFFSFLTLEINHSKRASWTFRSTEAASSLRDRSRNWESKVSDLWPMMVSLELFRFR